VQLITIPSLSTSHSIFFYLMDPNGQFVDAFGKNSTAADVTRKVMESVARWEASQ
jgi:protein SCO1/2